MYIELNLISITALSSFTVTLKYIFIPACFVTSDDVYVISDVTDKLIKMTQGCVYVLLLKLVGTYINVSGLNMSAVR